jgi:hypothetical protein
MKLLAAVIPDESDRLSTGGGKQKWALIKSSKGVPYKLSLTATPAPNEIMEFASQAAFLEKMRDNKEIIWTFFRRDEKTHRWTVKKHARRAFFEFMAGWSIYVRNPARYGWRKDVPPVPEPIIQEHIIPMTDAQREMFNTMHRDDAGSATLIRMSGLNTIQRMKLSQVAKGFFYNNSKGSAGRVVRIDSRKPEAVAKIVADEAERGHQVLVWTTFDAESDIIHELLRKRGLDGPLCGGSNGTVMLLTGKTPKDKRQAIKEAFRRGECQVLISRASVLGYGMNFQHCRSMVYSGFTDSYKHFYQSLRRVWRQGQKSRVRVHIPYIPELEGDSWDTILRKQDQHEASINEMEENYIAATKATRERQPLAISHQPQGKEST